MADLALADQRLAGVAPDVLALVAAETARRRAVPDVVGVGVPGDLHPRAKRQKMQSHGLWVQEFAR